MIVALSSLTDFFRKIILLKLHGAFGIGEELLASNSALYWVITAVLAVIAYLVGSINFSILISKLKYHDDIRKYGSGNAGFTNMKRVYGNKAGFAALAGDILKGAFCAGLTLLILGEDPAYIVGLACIIGHCFPIWYKFKGGKGVATTAALLLVLEPVVFLIAFLIFVLMIAITKYLSVGSMSAALLYPLILNNFYNLVYGSVSVVVAGEKSLIFASPIMNICSIFIALFIVFNHRSNIMRIWNGTENKFSLKSKGSKEESKENPNA